MGTTEGIDSLDTIVNTNEYNTKVERSEYQMVVPLVREVILAEDSVLFDGGLTPSRSTDSIAPIPTMNARSTKIPRINYKLNSLTFHYSAPYFEDEGGTEFSYFLKGWDDRWSNWSRERKKDYTSLPPGYYEFQVRAKNPCYRLPHKCRKTTF